MRKEVDERVMGNLITAINYMNGTDLLRCKVLAEDMDPELRNILALP
jgi:hypothetical protein